MEKELNPCLQNFAMHNKIFKRCAFSPLYLTYHHRNSSIPNLDG